MKNIDDYMKLKYRIALRHDDDGGFIAEVDELPGCIADGRTPNKAVENLRAAMKSWLSSRLEAGLEIPTPRDVDDYSGKILVRLPKTLHRKLARLAAIEGVSLNQQIVSTLSEDCGRSEALQAQTQNALRQAYSHKFNNCAYGTTWVQVGGFWDIGAAGRIEAGAADITGGTIGNPANSTNSTVISLAHRRGQAA